MGRDRAKEKIQAHRKAKLDRKEAKLELREIEEMEQKKKGTAERKQRNQPKKHNKIIRDYKTAGEDIEKQLININYHEECSDSPKFCEKFSPEIVGDHRDGVLEVTTTGDDYGDIVYGSNKMTGSILQQQEGKQSKLSMKIFTSGNPNHRMAHKPTWRLLHEETSALKEKANKLKKEIKQQSQIFKLEDALKPEELKHLRDVLDISGLDEVCPSVAAVALGRFDLIKKLIKDEQFGPDIVEGQRITPMGCAVLTLNWDMIQFILDKNINVHCRDSFGNTPLIKAALCPNWTASLMFDLWMMMKFEQETDLSGCNKAGVSFIHALAFRGWINVLDDVLDFIEDREKNSKLNYLINAAMSDGSTPLMLAIDKGDEAVCELLLSKGASPLTEDKAGFSSLCRGFGNLYQNITTFSRSCIPPICRMLIQALSGPEYDFWNFEIYTNRRLQVIMNPVFDGSFFNERFYRLGRASFLFILRCVSKGSELLLNARFFSRLATIGQRNIHQTDLVYTLCAIFFEVLVYVEDFPNLFPLYVNAFINDGAADFCLKLIQKPTSTFGDCLEMPYEKTDSRAPSISEVSSKLQEIKDNPESLAFMEKPLPTEKNLSLAAILPFIQLIDSPEMVNWFIKHFQTLSTCFHNLIEKSNFKFILKSSLSAQHAERTNRKSLLFADLMSQKDWISPCPMYSESKVMDPHHLSRNKKKKQNKKNRQKSIDDYLSRLPSTYVKPIQKPVVTKPQARKSQLFMTPLMKTVGVDTGIKNQNIRQQQQQLPVILENKKTVEKQQDNLKSMLGSSTVSAISAAFSETESEIREKLFKADCKIKKTLMDETNLIFLKEWSYCLDVGIWKNAKAEFRERVKALSTTKDLELVRFTNELFDKLKATPLGIIKLTSMRSCSDCMDLGYVINSTISDPTEIAETSSFLSNKNKQVGKASSAEVLTNTIDKPRSFKFRRTHKKVKDASTQSILVAKQEIFNKSSSVPKPMSEKLKSVTVESTKTTKSSYKKTSVYSTAVDLGSLFEVKRKAKGPVFTGMKVFYKSEEVEIVTTKRPAAEKPIHANQDKTSGSTSDLVKGSGDGHVVSPDITSNVQDYNNMTEQLTPSALNNDEIVEDNNSFFNESHNNPVEGQPTIHLLRKSVGTQTSRRILDLRKLRIRNDNEPFLANYLTWEYCLSYI